MTDRTNGDRGRNLEKKAKPAKRQSESNFVDRMQKFFLLLKADFDTVALHDPALQNKWEILFLYNGFWAVVAHRFLHVLWRHGFVVLSRLIGMIIKIITGVEIHPGARLGAGVFIDHGTGVVIGETAIVGENCLIYQSVTLGGSGKYKGKRHPTLGSGVVVGCNASILGPIIIGDHVRVGAGSVVTRDIPPDCTVVGIPGRYIRRKRLKDEVQDSLDHGSLADPNASAFKALYARELLIESSLKKFQEALVGAKHEHDAFNTSQTVGQPVSLMGAIQANSKSLDTLLQPAEGMWHPSSPKTVEGTDDAENFSSTNTAGNGGRRRDSMVARVARIVGMTSKSVRSSDEMDQITQEILAEYMNGGNMEVLVDGAGI